MKNLLSPISLLFLSSPFPAMAVDFTSIGSGLWQPSNPDNIWDAGANPQPGSVDNVFINSGHTVIFGNVAPGAGIAGSNDLGTAIGHSINLNGGILSQVATVSWVRIGDSSAGSLNINDGRFHITNGVSAGGETNLQVGLTNANGAGTINIGDGTGAAGSAVLNLRDIIDGNVNGTRAFSMNLGRNGGVGTVTVNSDGLLEGDQRDAGGTAPSIRIGQESSAFQSLLRVNAGGQFNARGNIDVATAVGAKGLLHLTGTGARMDMRDGDFTVGFAGTGAMLIENGAVFSRTNDASGRLDLRAGRSSTGNGTITVRTGGQFLRGPGGSVGDLLIGDAGTGTLNIENGGLVLNESSNWDFIGANNNGNGTLNIDTGGIYRTTGTARLNVANNTGSTGLIEVKGGLLDLSNATGGDFYIGREGNGTFRQTSGTTSVRTIYMAELSGTAAFDLRGGSVTTRSSFFMGGVTTGSTGTGIATGTQSGGSLDVSGALVIGLATGHQASYTMTGGSIIHRASDMTVGESGIGVMTIGATAGVSQTSSGSMYVGRNAGSSGTLFVNGTLSKTGSGNAIRVGDVNATGTGLLGGTGSITSAAGVRIGAAGTVTGGMNTTVGELTMNGNLAFSAGGTLFANFNTTGQADRLGVNGAVDISGAILAGDWVGGSSPTGTDSRYWLIVNDGSDAITGTFANATGTSASSAQYPDAGGFVTLSGQEFAIYYGANFDTNAVTGGNDLLLSAIPEPGVPALILFAGLAGAFRRRR